MPRGAVREVAVVLAGSLAVALVVSCTWHYTRSKQQTLAAGVASVVLACVMDKQRAYRRRQRLKHMYDLPIHVKFPGSTAL